MATSAKHVVLRLIDDVVNHADLELIDELVHRDFFSHGAPPTRASGRSGLIATVTALQRAFAAFRIDPRDVIVAEDKVIVRATASGRDHRGECSDTREWSAQQIHIFRIADRKVIEHWFVCEQTGGRLPARDRDPHVVQAAHASKRGGTDS